MSLVMTLHVSDLSSCCPPVVYFLSGCRFAHVNDSSGTVCTLLTSIQSVQIKQHLRLSAQKGSYTYQQRPCELAGNWFLQVMGRGAHSVCLNDLPVLAVTRVRNLPDGVLGLCFLSVFSSFPFFLIYARGIAQELIFNCLLSSVLKHYSMKCTNLR